MANRECKECGKGFQTRQYNADFCGAACRRVFNNRRATRGATLYDLVMLADAETTKPSTQAEFKERAATLVAMWKKEDQKAGRKRTTKRLSDVQADTLYAAHGVRWYRTYGAGGTRRRRTRSSLPASSLSPTLRCSN